MIVDEVSQAIEQLSDASDEEEKKESPRFAAQKGSQNQFKLANQK